MSGDVLVNDSDANGDALSVQSVAGGALGQVVVLASGATVIMQANGSYTYDPNGAFDGLATGETDTDSFTYVISDGQGGTDTGTVTVSVTGISAPTVTEALFIDFESAPDGTYSGEGDLSASGVTVASNAGVIDGTTAQFSVDGGTLDFDTVTFTSLSGRARITVEALDENGQVVGSARLNLRGGREATREFDTTFDGATTVTISSTSPISIDDLSIVTIVESEIGGNFDPSARNDAFDVAEGPALSGNLLADNEQGADTDPDGDPVQVVSVEGASSGPVALASGAPVTFASDGTFSYQQNNAFDALYDGQTGTDTFDYTISDGNGGTDTATVVVSIQGSGTPPPQPVETLLDFSTDPNVDGFIFNDTQLVTNGGDGEGQSVGDSLTITRSDGADFDFDAGMVRAVTGKNVTAVVQGFDDGVLVVEESFRMKNKGDTVIPTSDPEWDSVDQLTISAAGGVYVDDFSFVF